MFLEATPNERSGTHNGCGKNIYRILFSLNKHICFPLSTRSLAFFRIGLGVLLLVDLLHRSTLLTLHYTQGGALPANWFVRQVVEGRPSLHSIFMSEDAQLLLFGVAAFFAVLLIAGWNTRLVTVVSWALLLSLQNHNPFVLHGGDEFLLLLLFWGIFLPLGKRLSLDAKVNRAKTGEKYSLCNIATVALVLQVAVVYLYAGIKKGWISWWQEGSALSAALQLDAFTSGLGSRLLHLSDATLATLSRGVFAIEILAPLLLIFFFRRSLFRLGSLLVLAALNIGFLVFLNLGIFPWVGMVSLLPLLPERDRQHEVRTGLLKRNGYGAWIAGILIGFGLLFGVASTITFFFGGVRVAPPFVYQIGEALRLDQRWDMYKAPSRSLDGWFAMQELDGSYRRNLFPFQDSIKKKPPNTRTPHHTMKGYYYLYASLSEGRTQYLQGYVLSMCRNLKYKKTEQLRLVFVEERQGAVLVQPILRCDCAKMHCNELHNRIY